MVPQTNICSTTNYVVRSTSKSSISTNGLGAVYKLGMVSWNIVYVNSHIDWISLEEEVHTSKQWINTKPRNREQITLIKVQYTKYTETVKYKHMEKLHGIRL